MSYAINVLTQLPFGNIIGGPMKAAIEAQALAAKSTIDFIQTVGFKKQTGDEMFPTPSGTGEVDSADFGDIRTVTFVYSTHDTITNTSKDVELTVPILTIVPIPFLRIDEMTIDFTAKILEEFKHAQTSKTDIDFSTSTNGSWKSWWSPVSVNFTASLSTKHSSTAASSSRLQTECTMNVHVRAVQDAIPAGLGRVLNILETSAITSVKKP